MSLKYRGPVAALPQLHADRHPTRGTGQSVCLSHLTRKAAASLARLFSALHQGRSAVDVHYVRTTSLRAVRQSFHPLTILAPRKQSSSARTI
jgi:hypothetical protein